MADLELRKGFDPILLYSVTYTGDPFTVGIDASVPLDKSDDEDGSVPAAGFARTLNSALTDDADNTGGWKFSRGGRAGLIVVSATLTTSTPASADANTPTWQLYVDIADTDYSAPGHYVPGYCDQPCINPNEFSYTRAVQGQWFVPPTFYDEVGVNVGISPRNVRNAEIVTVELYELHVLWQPVNEA